jgi:hypothetical protein
MAASKAERQYQWRNRNGGEISKMAWRRMAAAMAIIMKINESENRLAAAGVSGGEIAERKRWRYESAGSSEMKGG